MKFCKNCKWMKRVVTYGSTGLEVFFGCSITHYAPYTPWDECKNKNTDGNCQDYKRKFWKFWVKP